MSMMTTAAKKGARQPKWNASWESRKQYNIILLTLTRCKPGRCRGLHFERRQRDRYIILYMFRFFKKNRSFDLESAYKDVQSSIFRISNTILVINEWYKMCQRDGFQARIQWFTNPLVAQEYVVSGEKEAAIDAPTVWDDHISVILRPGAASRIGRRRRSLVWLPSSSAS